MGSMLRQMPFVVCVNLRHNGVKHKFEVDEHRFDAGEHMFDVTESGPKGVLLIAIYYLDGATRASTS